MQFIDSSDLKEIGGKYLRTSREGLFSGATVGRLGGGYLSLRASESVIDDAEVFQLYPSQDLGALGPEELAVYGGMVSGYVLGGILTAKAVTKIQEHLDIEFEERRPVNEAIERFEDIRDYLSTEEKGEETEEIKEEAIGYLFEDDED